MLPDGLVAVVKRECETCLMIVPVLQQLADAGTLTIYTQDDPEFPDAPRAILDDEPRDQLAPRDRDGADADGARDGVSSGAPSDGCAKAGRN